MQVADPISALVNGMNDMHILYLDAISPNKIVVTQDCLMTPKDQSSVGWSTPPSYDEVQNGHILRQFDDQTSTEDKIRDMCERWSPTKTPVAFCDWISIDRGTVHRTHQFQIENMQAAFRTLSEINVDALDQLACQHEVLSGKWLLFVKASVVDSIWKDVVRLVCLYRKTGCAKVTPNKGTDFYLICVYVEDYTTEELHLVRDGLRSIGVTWPIGFKMDAYTHLGIYAKNPWSIRPNRFWL